MCSGVRPIIFLRFESHCERAPVARVDRDDRRFVEDDTAPAHIDECVRGSKIDRHVAAEQACVNRFRHELFYYGWSRPG